MRAFALPLATAILWGLNYHFAKRMIVAAPFAEVGLVGLNNLVRALAVVRVVELEIEHSRSGWAPASEGNGRPRAEAQASVC